MTEEYAGQDISIQYDGLELGPEVEVTVRIESRYNQEAEDLELGLQGRVPLLYWRVLRYEEMLAEWHLEPEFTGKYFRVKVSAYVNGQKLVGDSLLARDLWNQAIFDVATWWSRMTVERITKAILNWKPKKEEGDENE